MRSQSRRWLNLHACNIHAGVRVLQVREESISVQGVGVNYCVAGSGPAMILVHGLVGSAHNWDQNMAALARQRTVYALDLANMGRSQRVAGLDPGLAASADRLAAFMDALDIAKADVCGHSHGGAISMMLAARHPERVGKLVLFAPANPYCELGRGLIAFYNTRVGSFIARLIPVMPRRVHDMAHKRVYGDPSRATRAALDDYTRNLNRDSIEHILGIVRGWWQDMAVLRAGLKKLAGRPVLLIWGDRDFVVGLASGRRLAEELGAQLVVLPGVGHLPFAEEPEVCNEAVGSWLRA